MKKERLLVDAFQWGVLTAIVVCALPDLAFAALDSSVANFRDKSVVFVPPLINAIAFAGGAALGVGGALKLKAHTENPGQVKFATGVGYLLAGGGLAALPILIQTAIDTLHIGAEDGTGIAFTPWDTDIS